jgi:hypothetical protein
MRSGIADPLLARTKSTEGQNAGRSGMEVLLILLGLVTAIFGLDFGEFLTALLAILEFG